MTYTIQIPAKSESAWRWENYKARLAAKGVMVDVNASTIAKSTASQKPKG